MPTEEILVSSKAPDQYNNKQIKIQDCQSQDPHIPASSRKMTGSRGPGPAPSPRQGLRPRGPRVGTAQRRAWSGEAPGAPRALVPAFVVETRCSANMAEKWAVRLLQHYLLVPPSVHHPRGYLPWLAQLHPTVTWRALSVLSALTMCYHPFSSVKSGHLVCSNCRPKLTCCPTCCGLLGSIRNLAMEKVANPVLFLLRVK
jgi:hypothetical protein